MQGSPNGYRGMGGDIDQLFSYLYKEKSGTNIHYTRQAT